VAIPFSGGAAGLRQLRDSAAAAGGVLATTPFQRLNAIVKGRRSVSADTALLLEALTRWDAEIWWRLRAKWDLWHALQVRGSRPKVRALTKSA
jgi:plasmid maintenance system antidote protein VapI